MAETYLWDAAKDDWLRQVRGFGFEQVVEALSQGRLLADIPHRSERYPNQRLLVLELDGEAIVVPYVRSGDAVFFKTAYPSRRMRRRYLASKGDL